MVAPTITRTPSSSPAATLPADLDPDSRSRLPYLKRADMDEGNQKIFDVLPGRGQDGVLRGPLAFAAYIPAVAKALFDTFAKAVQLFGKKGAMDLVAVINTYAVSGFYATAVDEYIPAGRPDLERPARQ